MILHICIASLLLTLMPAETITVAPLLCFGHEINDDILVQNIPGQLQFDNTSEPKTVFSFLLKVGLILLLGLLILLTAIAILILFWVYRRKIRKEQSLPSQENRTPDAASLRKNEPLFRHIIDNMPVMVNAYHSSGQIVYWNRECERVTGYAAEEIVNNSLAIDMLYPNEEYRTQIQKQWKKMGSYYRDWELEVTCKNGQKKSISWSNISDLAPVPGWYSWGIGVDVTDRIQSEKKRVVLEGKIQNLQKLESLGVLAGGIAHDFNNLLMAILGNTELLKMETPETEETKEYFHEMETAIGRAADLCKQMLAFSGKEKFYLQTIDINHILSTVEAVVRPSLPPEIELIIEPNNDPLWIEADSTQIRQAVVNLITNARESIGSKPGKISLQSGFCFCEKDDFSESWLHSDEIENGMYVFLRITDTGCGMQKEMLDRIFDPFYSTKFIGRGLGLPVVLGIVRGHHGAIKIHSDPNEGTAIEMLVPASLQSIEKHEEDLSQLLNWKGDGAVLLVDDDEFVQVVAKRMLLRAGFQVLTACDGREAIAIYQRHRKEIVCVLLDLVMPVMGGEQTFRELRKMDPDVKVVFTSGYSEQDVQERVKEQRGYIAGFIHKPYQSYILYKTLQSVLSPR